MSGCNLRCGWCDSPKTSWSPEGDFETTADLVGFCATGPRHVVLTGGEPLLFAPVATLARTLRTRGHHVTVETSGTRWQDGLECDLLSVSPKLEHSNPDAPSRASLPVARAHEARRLPIEVLRRLLARHPWQLKPVVRARDESILSADLEEVDRLLETLGIDSAADRARVFLMPEGVDAVELARDYRRLAPHCQARGLRLGQRLHIELFGHTPGT